MPITINGNGTVTGLSVGGLPDGSVDRDTLATAAKGTILQVKNTTYNATTDISCSPQNQYYTVSDIDVTITPTATSSKILLNAHIMGEGDHQDYHWHYRFAKTVGGTTTALTVGATAGSRVLCLGLPPTGYYSNDQSTTPVSFAIPEFYDSPSTTSAITYHVQLACNSSSKTWYLNNCRDGGSDDNSSVERGVSWLTVKEIAA